MLRVFCCSLSCIIETSSNLHLLKLFIFAWFKMHLVYKTCIRDDTRKAPPPQKKIVLLTMSYPRSWILTLTDPRTAAKKGVLA